VSGRSPSTAFGIPVYNGAQHLAEALESLLTQSRRDLAVVVVDDCSTDGTGEIVQRYAQLDPRIVYERNEQTLGLVHNWRRAFDLTGRHFPEASYFAWASDHDVWDRSWLESLESELEGHPEAVLAYPVCVRVGDSGSELRSREHLFDTAGVEDPAGRLRRTIRGMPAGDMIYGLFRRDALERCGPFPLVVLPDRLHLARLSLEGEFRQLRLRLWRRRYREGLTFALSRQRRAFFVDRVPARANLPWWVAHTVLFVRSVRGHPSRLQFGAAYLLESVRVEVTRRVERRDRRHGWRQKRRRRLRRRVVGTIRRRLGRELG